MSHVFSVPCTLELDKMTPSTASVSFDDEHVFAPCLKNEAISFPLDWLFALMRATTKLCKGVEVHDSGMVPIAVFDMRKDAASCHATVRVRASALAIRFLTCFLREFDGWNGRSYYPVETSERAVTYSGVAKRLAHKAGKNVCSEAFTSILKSLKVSTGATETRFWWTRVDRYEKLIFLETLAVIKSDASSKSSLSSWEACVATALFQEEAKLLRSSDQLADWTRKRAKRAKSAQESNSAEPRREITNGVAITGKQIQVALSTGPKAAALLSATPSPSGTTATDTISCSASSLSSSRSSSRSSSPEISPHRTRSPSPVRDETDSSEPTPMGSNNQRSTPVHLIPLLGDHYRLRSCNFPPRTPGKFDENGHVGACRVAWETQTPCLSGIVFGPMIDGGHGDDHSPRGMPKRAHSAYVPGFVSIW